MNREMDRAIEILRSAIKSEEAAAMKYLELAVKIKSTAGKDLFIRLAMDEIKHKEFLEKELNSYLQDKKSCPVEIDRTLIEDIVPKLPKSGYAIYQKEEVGELEALQAALELERKSVETYSAALKEIEDKNMKELLKRFVEIEEAHYTLIQTEIDSIKNSGYWFDFMEFSVEARG